MAFRRHKSNDRGQKLRGVQKDAELRELVIMGLTHLVIANSEHGFKQCLPLAYDPDSRKRSIFAHVFAKVISQGTVFDAEDKAPNASRQAALTDVGDCSPSAATSMLI